MRERIKNKQITKEIRGQLPGYYTGYVPGKRLFLLPLLCRKL